MGQQLDAPDSPRLPTQRELYEDLRALQGEFPGLRVRFQEETLSVTTEPIELGPFEIRLD